MKKILIIFPAILFVTLTAKGQNLFFIGENSYQSTETITLKSNTEDTSDLNVLFARDGRTGLIAVIAESSLGSIFSDKLIVYLVDGTVITCNRKTYDLVDNLAKAVYSFTSDQLNKMKNSNLHTVRYTLELRADGGRLLGEMSRTASNKEVQTATLITDFFDN